MIWYAFEILMFLALLSVAFVVYRVLVNSPEFTRFIERTKGTDETDMEDAAIRLVVAEEQADETIENAQATIKRQAAALRSLKRRKGH